MTQSDQHDTPTPKALWQPNGRAETNLGKFMGFVESRSGLSFDTFTDIHRWSVEHNDAFWNALWDFADIKGNKGMQVKTAIDSVPWARFFPDSQISYTENALARVQTHPDEPAIIHRLQNNDDRILSWQMLYDEVSRWEQALSAEGLSVGDHIGVYLPNVPETVIILLAASNLGIVFTSAGMEMGRDDLVNRFAQVRPKLLITAEGYIHATKKVSRLDVVAHAQNDISTIAKTVVLPMLGEVKPDLSNLKDSISLDDFISRFKPIKITYNRRDFNHPLYVLFSSGSTGKPKCFEHSTGGVFLKHISEYMLHCDVKPGDRVFYHATPSWMMWNWLVSGLCVGATILMYDGSPAFPDVYAQWDFASAHKCTHHGTAAPVILNWAANNLILSGRYDVSALRMVMSTGAVLPAQGFEFIHENVKPGVKIGSITGGTDLVGVFAGGNALTCDYAGQLNGPFLGLDVQVWDDDARSVCAGEVGELVCVNAFPSMPLRFLSDEDGARYKSEYFEHYDPAITPTNQPVWRHGDSVEVTAEGQLTVIGRSDATLNQNGVRIGASAIYEQLAPFEQSNGGAVLDFAAVDFTRPDNKQALTVLFLALDGFEKGVDEALQKAIKTAVKDNVTPYAMPSEIIGVPDILKTPNGKKAEVVMKKIINGASIPNATLYGEDLVSFFENIGQTLKEKYSA